MRQAVRDNVRASAQHLRRGSKILEQLIQNEGLLVVGAEYSLETGVVDFFEVMGSRLTAVEAPNKSGVDRAIRRTAGARCLKRAREYDHSDR